MGALTADRKTSYKEGVETAYKVAAATKIYAGSLVCLNASGYAVPGADTSGLKFLGIAQEYIDNSSGANGDLSISVRRKGIHRLAASGMAITDIGAVVYVSDDQTVAKTTTNLVKCGKIAEFISATEVGVDVDIDRVPANTVIFNIELPAFTANTVVTHTKGIPIGRAMTVKRISMVCQTKPVDADGTCLLAVNNWDKSGAAADALLAASKDLEGLVAVKEAEDLTLTATGADLILAAGDFIYCVLTNNSAAIDTNMVGGNIAIEAELV